MTDSEGPPKVYIDNSVLRALRFDIDVVRLLAECRAKRISLYISEATLWERGRQQHEFEGARLIPIRIEIGKYLAWFKILFENYGVVIIPTTQIERDRVAFYTENKTTYFKKEDFNDQRDALVLATAEVNLEKSTLVLCHDKNLKIAFNEMGFGNICPDVNKYLQGLKEANPTIPAFEKPDIGSIDDGSVVNTFSKHFQEFIQNADPRSKDYLLTLPALTLPTMTDKLDAILANMQELDAEMRRRILGYTHWFSPIGKQDLYNFLAPIGYEPARIDANAQRLKQENLLLETADAWLTNNMQAEPKEICEQAMSTVITEILALLEN